MSGLESCDLRSHCGITDRPIVTVVDVYDGASDQAGAGFRVDVHRQGEGSDVSVILHEFNLLDEEGRRFDRASFDPNQASGKDIQVEAAFKQSDALLTWLQLIDVHYASVQLARSLKGKFVIRGSHGG